MLGEVPVKSQDVLHEPRARVGQQRLDGRVCREEEITGQAMHVGHELGVGSALRRSVWVRRRVHEYLFVGEMRSCAVQQVDHRICEFPPWHACFESHLKIAYGGEEMHTLQVDSWVAGLEPWAPHNRDCGVESDCHRRLRDRYVVKMLVHQLYEHVSGHVLPDVAVSPASLHYLHEVLFGLR